MADTTDSRPSPADFPLGSLQSRAAARIIHQEMLRNASEQERRKQFDLSCAAWTISHKQGPMYWLRNWTQTEIYQWKEQGLNPVAPFPYKPWPKGSRKIDFDALRQEFKHDFTEDDPPDYLDAMMGYLMTSKELNIPKTREMMITQPITGNVGIGDEDVGSTLRQQESAATRVKGCQIQMSCNPPHSIESESKTDTTLLGCWLVRGNRCIPSTQLWLTVDACAAYRFPHNVALRVQLRLGNLGFTTVLEEIRD